MNILSQPTLVIHNIGTLLTMTANGTSADVQDELGLVRNSIIVAAGDTILFAGSEAEFDSYNNTMSEHTLTIIDAKGGVVTPGLVDAHTHLVFAGHRSQEFHLRHAGATYEEIQANGGGIASTVNATRSASFTELVDLTKQRLKTMCTYGTTTVEAKTGYGLSVSAEELLLSIANRCAALPRIPRVISTFLGAHVVPPEFQDNRAAYVRLVCDEMLPAFVGRAMFCDVFCDRGAFTVAEARAILTTAKSLGYLLKMHAGQWSNTGNVALAAEMGVISADHLDCATDSELDALADNHVVPILLPGCSMSLGTPFPDARRFFAHGLPVALATDFNPGTSYSENLQMMIDLAIAHMHMTVEQALLAVTKYGALALAQRNIGTIAAGQRCDLAIWHINDYREIGYHFGINLVRETVIGGNLC